MIDYAKRLRSGALLASLTVVVFHIALGLGHFGILLFRGVRFGPAAQQSGASSVPLIWVFAVLALSLAAILIRPPVQHARRLVGAATIVVGVAALVGLVSWFFGLFGGFTLGSALAAVGGLIESLAKVACAVVLWRLRSLTAGRTAEPADGQAAEQPGEQPVWQPQQAIGLQWHRAGDAATGAQAPELPAAASSPQPEPEPVPRQLWSRGGVPPEQLPWTTAAQAAEGDQPASELPDPQEQARRPAPDWTPARPPQEGDF